MNAIARFVERRRALADEYVRIVRVERDARALVEELNLRRDGMGPRRLDLPYLRQALAEVDAVASPAASGYGQRP